MARVSRILLSVLVGVPAVAGVSSSAVSALSYPAPFSYFGVCTTADQEFCVEKLEFTPSTGASAGQKRDIAVPTRPDPFGGNEPVVQAFISGNYSGPATQASSGFLPALAINYYDPAGSMNPTPPAKTTVGLADGLYRVVVRVGDYDPSYMMLTGKFDAYTVTKGSDCFYTVDVSARPTPLAQVAELNGDRSMLDTCEANKWLAPCEANMAYRGYILASFVTVGTAADRDATRGSWVSTNASVFSLGTPNFLTGQMTAVAKGPHYVPTDFGISGLTQENGRELAPAYFEMFVPFTTMTSMLSRMAGRDVTVDQVKTFLSQPKDVMEGKIKEAPSASAAAVEKAQELTTTVGDTGVRVNFNLKHFSAPDPTLQLKVPPALSTGTGTGTGSGTTTGSDSAASTRTTKKLSSGATVSMLKTTTAGKSLSSKTLLSPSSGARVASIASRTTTICTVKGTTLRVLKKGTCRYTATVTYKGKRSSVSGTISAS